MRTMNDRDAGAARPTETRRRWKVGVLVTAVTVLAAACDLDVMNPGEILDEDLRDPVILGPLLTGAESDYSRGLVDYRGGVISHGGLMTDELVHSGSLIALQLASHGRPGIVDGQGLWDRPAAARWVTENAIRLGSLIVADQAEDPDLDPRTIVDPDAHPGIARITFFAGMSHRTLGDNFCNVVYDVGPLLPYTDAYPRAIEHFENTIMRASNRIAAVQADTTLDPGAIANEIDRMDRLIQAANGAMAQSYLILASEKMGEQYWDLAAYHAGKVDTDFAFSARMQSGDRNTNEYNSLTRSRVEVTMWGTTFADWGLNVEEPENGGDPRVPYEAHLLPDGRYEAAYDSRRPAFIQRRYTSNSANIPLVKGTEMRLIEAEVALVRQGDYQMVVDKINEVREHYREVPPGWWHDLLGSEPLPLHDPVSSVEEAWAALMRERGVELFAEGRRLSDIRRWQHTPGREHIPFTTVRAGSGLADPWTDEQVSVFVRDNGEVIPPSEMCLQISLNERSANPNIEG